MTTKVGVTFDWRGATSEGISQIAKTADELGYDSLWIPEAWGTEGFATCGYLLEQTNKIKLRTGIPNTYSRSAALIGMGSLTLLQIDPNRFALGLGTSGRGLVEGWHGMKFERPLERMREYVEVIKKVVRGDVVDYDGKVLKLNRFRAFTKIPQGNDFKIYLAALGDKSLKLAGEISDGAILIFYSKHRLAHAKEQLNFSAPIKDRELVAMIPTEVTDDTGEEKSILSMKKRIAFYVSSMGEYYAKMLKDSGFATTVEKVQEAHRQGEKERSLEAVPKELVDELCLVGRAEEIRKNLETLQRNVTPIIGLRISSTSEISDSIKTLRALAPI